MAATEHDRSAVGFSSSKTQLGDRFGVGIYLYFDFIRYITATNIVLLILGTGKLSKQQYLYIVTALANTIPHLLHDGFKSSKNGISIPFYWNFYISTYTPDTHQLWELTTVIAFVVWFLFGYILSPIFDYQDQSMQFE